MDRADLELVVRIRDVGTLAGAAEQLQLHAPAASKRLATLEQHLGTKLFHRTTRRVTATAEGELLYERAVQLLEGFTQAEEALRNQAQEPSGHIRLAATFGFGRIWLGSALADFQRLYPKLSIDLQLTETLPDLGAHGFDAAVWLWSVQANRHSQWSSTLLARNERVLVAAPSYVQTHGRPRNAQELRQHDCLLVRESHLPSNIWVLSKEGERDTPVRVQVSGFLSSNSGELVRDWCLQGRGIMLRSNWDVAPLLASGALLRILPSYSMRDANIQWLAPFRAQTPLRIQLLREFLMARFKNNPWLAKGNSATKS